jgi:hypothetical protein
MPNRSVGKEANDKAMKRRIDPVGRRKLAAGLAELPKQMALQYPQNTEDTAQVIKYVAHIQRCIHSAHPPSADAWQVKMDCLTNEDPAIQEMNAVVDAPMAQQARKTQPGRHTKHADVPGDGAGEMRDMEFRISRHAATFATEARIHHLCKVAGVIEVNCLTGPALVLVTQLGPEMFSEWKAALINAATGKTPRIVNKLLDKVMSGMSQPGGAPLEYNERPHPGVSNRQAPRRHTTWHRCGRCSSNSEGQS